MERPHCPRCGAFETITASWALARRCGIIALGTFWVGLLAMMVLGLLGASRVGISLWIVLTAAPLAYFLAYQWRHRHDASYRRGYQCTRCGERWVESIVSRLQRRDVERAQVTQERLHWLERQRQANS